MGNIVIPKEVIEKRHILNDMLLDKLTLTSDINNTLFYFREYNTEIGNYNGVYVFETKSKLRFGVTEYKQTKKLTRYNSYVLEIARTQKEFIVEDLEHKLILYKSNDYIVYVNTNLDQIMRILFYGGSETYGN